MNVPNGSGDVVLGQAVTKSKEPVCVPRSLFGHMHIRGMTGSGKTSLSFIPLIRQFMEPYEDGGARHEDPICVFDLSGDANLFFNTKHAAERLGRTFRFLTLDPDLDTFLFPPFQAIPTKRRNAIRICQLLVQAFHLDHGLVYGGQYFTQQNTAALLAVAEKVGPDGTLEDVTRVLDEPANRKLFRDADQVRLMVGFLERKRQLRSGDPEREILFERAIENSEVIYFFTPTLDEPITARPVAGLGLQTLVSAAMRRKREGQNVRRIRVFVDEFQEIAGRSLAALLAQSRKFGLSLFLANQSTSQLDEGDVKLSDVVFEGTALKQYFTCVGDKDTEVLQSLSKDKIRTLGGKSVRGPLAVSHNLRDEVVPTLERDEILDVTYLRGECLVVLNDGAGHKEPIRVTRTHDYPDESATAMPRARMEPERAAVTPPVRELTPERRRRQAALSAAREAKRAAERFELGSG